MANEDIDLLVADILTGLGEHERASWVMAGLEPVGEAAHARCEDTAAALMNLLGEVPENTDRHTHVEDARAEYGPDGKVTRKATQACWRTRAQCLADRIRELIDNDS